MSEICTCIAEGGPGCWTAALFWKAGTQAPLIKLLLIHATPGIPARVCEVEVTQESTKTTGSAAQHPEHSLWLHQGRLALLLRDYRLFAAMSHEWTWQSEEELPQADLQKRLRKWQKQADLWRSDLDSEHPSNVCGVYLCPACEEVTTITKDRYDEAGAPSCEHCAYEDALFLVGCARKSDLRC